MVALHPQYTGLFQSLLASLAESVNSAKGGGTCVHTSPSLGSLVTLQGSQDLREHAWKMICYKEHSREVTQPQYVKHCICVLLSLQVYVAAVLPATAQSAC
jgi:hypothetical protein